MGLEPFSRKDQGPEVSEHETATTFCTRFSSSWPGWSGRAPRSPRGLRKTEGLLDRHGDAAEVASVLMGAYRLRATTRPAAPDRGKKRRCRQPPRDFYGRFQGNDLLNQRGSSI